LGKSDVDFFPEDHARRTLEHEQKVMQTGHAITREEKQTWPDGSVTWALTTKIPFRSEQGTIIGTVGISHDITRRKQSEDELEERVQQRTKELQAANIALLLRVTEREQSNQRLETLLNEANHLKAALDQHAIVAVTDLRGKIISVNDKFCTISKYSREELIGQDHRILNSGFHPKQFMRDMWMTISHGKIWNGEFRNRAKDGTMYWIETTIVPNLNDDGKPYQYITISTDITELKSAEEALKCYLPDIDGQSSEAEKQK
jgi:PAS domain S-box-containing protein